MLDQTHPWLPTTRAQSVLVYGLNVLLLFNVTVILVMLAGPRPADERASRHATDASVAEVLPDRVRVEPMQADVADQVVVSDPIIEPRVSHVVETAPPKKVSEQPFVLAEASDAREDKAAEHRPQLQPTSEDDSPVTFFGIGLE